MLSNSASPGVPRGGNPLVIAILGASIAAAGSAYVSRENNQGNLSLETYKAESARIFEVVKTGDPDKAAKNLSFLLDTGLIQNAATANEIKQYLEKRKQGEGVSLPADRSSSSLRGQDLSNQNLSGTDLSGADLSGADLSTSYLSNANLRGANLSHADLSKANLRSANLSGAKLTIADLSDADLTGADLSGVRLTDAHLSGADLSGANLSNAKALTQAQLDQACGEPPKNLPKDLKWVAERPCPQKPVAPRRNRSGTP